MINKKTNGKEGFTKKNLLGIINRTYKGFYEDPFKTTVGFHEEESDVEAEEFPEN